MNDRAESFDWHGRTARAFVPPVLSERSFALTEDCIRATEHALAELRLMEQRMVPAAEPIGRLLLRSEGVASSAIEGLNVPLTELLATEAIGEGTAAASWVAGNLTAVTSALEDRGQPLEAATLHRWHRQLMQHSTLDPALHGAWRPVPGWIGGSSPLDAVYVPPLPDRIPQLIEDLIQFANRNDLDPITQAALAHAQFETIHPYGDGNGRTGRVLVGWVLARRGAVRHYPPPVSVTILRDPGGYLSGLFDFREGDPIRWIEWFAGRTATAATTSADLFELVDGLTQGWQSVLTDIRADSTAHRIVERLPIHPVISATTVVNHWKVSRRSALTSLDLLETRGILNELTVTGRGRGRPSRWWIASDLVSLVERWLG